MIQQVSFLESNFEVTASENTNSREQVAFSLQSLHILIQSISFLMQVPSTNLLSISREEHFDIQLMAFLSIRRWLLRQSECHPKSNGLADSEWFGEVNAAMGVRDVAPPIIAVHTEAPALPSWKAEGWIWWCEEAEGNAGVNLRLPALLEVVACMAESEDLDFEIDGLLAFSD